MPGTWPESPATPPLNHLTAANHVSNWANIPSHQGSLTSAVMLILRAPVDQRPELLKVLPGLVQHRVQRTLLLSLVLPPMPFVGEAEDALAIGNEIRNFCQQCPNRIEDAHCSGEEETKDDESLLACEPRLATWAGGLGGVVISDSQRTTNNHGVTLLMYWATNGWMDQPRWINGTRQGASKSTRRRARRMGGSSTVWVKLSKWRSALGSKKPFITIKVRLWIYGPPWESSAQRCGCGRHSVVNPRRLDTSKRKARLCC